MDLTGTVAIVTGGNGGLGQRICRGLATEGSRIAVVYAKSRDEADGVASGLTAGRRHGRGGTVRRDGPGAGRSPCCGGA